MDDTAAEWAAERSVSAAEAAELIGGRFARLRGAPVEALADGWDNTVFLVGGEWIFRFPRRAKALPGVRREIEVLPELAPHLPLPVPVPEFVGEPSRAYPWPYWGARHLPGRELAETVLPVADRETAGAGLGAFLQALHDPALVRGAAAGLTRDPLSRAEPSVRVPQARERLARLVRLGLREPDPAVARLLEEGERVGPYTGPVTVVHGDLHLRHLLLGDDGQAAGVIDWGDLCLADASVDLSLAYAGFAGPARTALLAAYVRPVGPEREVRARVLAVFLCAALAEYAALTGREPLLGESLRGIGRAARD